MMKFIISRASEWDDEKKPHKDAKREGVVYCYIEKMSVEQLKAKYPRMDATSYENYTTESGEIWCSSVKTQKEWVIEIDNLVDFLKTLDHRIILGQPYNCDLPRLHIYDDYIE